jgi:hypothetical protein
MLNRNNSVAVIVNGTASVGCMARPISSRKMGKQQHETPPAEITPAGNVKSSGTTDGFSFFFNPFLFLEREETF